MAIAKEAQHQNEVALHQLRFEGGVQAARAWLIERQAEIHLRWPDMTGDDLMRMQGEAKLIARLLRLIDHGPTIKQPLQRGE